MDSREDTAITPTERDLIGKSIDHFRIDGLLGAGGMGRVYKAFDTALHRPVALKIVAPGLINREFLLRFDREGRALAAVSHPYLAHIYSIGRFEDRPYYVMELINGSSLEGLLDQHGHLAGMKCLRYLIEACEGLQAASAAGIVHRDIKPSNLMVDASDHIKIVDFGLARWTEDDMSLTPTAMAMGTPRYIAPEQAKGQKCDQRADIYSLGATFYHLFSGAPPFEADTPFGLLMHHVNTPLPPLKEKNPRVPTAVSSIIGKMMAKQPEDRYQDYAELLSDLQHVVTAKSFAQNAPTVRTLSEPLGLKSFIEKIPPERRSPKFLAGAGAAVLLVLFLLFRGDDDPKQTAAEPASPAEASREVAKKAPGVEVTPDATPTDRDVRNRRSFQPELSTPAYAEAPRDRDGEPAVRFDRGNLMTMAARSQTLVNMRQMSVVV